MNAVARRALKGVIRLAILTCAACGGGGGNSPPTYTIGGTVSGLVGSGSVLTDNGVDRIGVAANGAFTFPTRVATGSDYSVYVSVQPAAPVQRCKVSAAAGRVGGTAVTDIQVVCVTPMLSLFAGTLSVAGTADGNGSAAQFNSPRGIASDSSGNLYIADTLNNTVRKITPDSGVTTLAGTPYTAATTDDCQSADGIGATAQFCWPWGIRPTSPGMSMWRTGAKTRSARSQRTAP